MELRHLRYFAAVAEERHFGRAAARLGIAQPPLSKQVQDLERELGFELFDRSRRPIELTAAGETLLEHARAALHAVEAGVHEARRAAEGRRGRISVGYPSSLAYCGLTDILRAFRKQAPDVTIRTQPLPSGGQIEGLLRGELHVGFVRGPLHEPSLVSEVVRRERLMLALPPDHPLTARKRLALRDVSREPFVFFPRDRGPAFFDFLVGFCRNAGFSPKVVQEASQVDVLSLVAAGFGVSIVPDSVREIRRDDIVLRPLLDSPVSELRLVWHRDNRSPAVARFIEVVRCVGVHPRRNRRRRAKRT
ncbi:MAG: LysR family transcriptional regulator [Pseudomonadota bacterium]|nr:MAG: LysR family transcriptional regulator [Pseudomonadota bacterium]